MESQTTPVIGVLIFLIIVAIAGYLGVAPYNQLKAIQSTDPNLTYRVNQAKSWTLSGIIASFVAAIGLLISLFLSTKAVYDVNSAMSLLKTGTIVGIIVFIAIVIGAVSYLVASTLTESIPLVSSRNLFFAFILDFACILVPFIFVIIIMSMMYSKGSKIDFADFN